MLVTTRGADRKQRRKLINSLLNSVNTVFLKSPKVATEVLARTAVTLAAAVAALLSSPPPPPPPPPSPLPGPAALAAAGITSLPPPSPLPTSTANNLPESTEEDALDSESAPV